MESKFEMFHGGPTQACQTRIYITLNDKNVFTLNDTCYRLLGKPPSVYLYFSRADDMIAIKPVHSYQLPAAFPVKSMNHSWRINAAPFCQHFGIRLDTTERFISPDLRDGALQLKLRETVTTRQNRRKKKS